MLNCLLVTAYETPDESSSLSTGPGIFSFSLSLCEVCISQTMRNLLNECAPDIYYTYEDELRAIKSFLWFVHFGLFCCCLLHFVYPFPFIGMVKWQNCEESEHVAISLKWAFVVSICSIRDQAISTGNKNIVFIMEIEEDDGELRDNKIYHIQ